MEKRIALLFWFGLCAMACSNGNVTPPAKTSAQIPGMPQSLSATGEEQLRAIIASGKLDNLQWPNFSSDQPPVKEFYDESGHQLGWISNGRPTPQALEMIELLLQAKGLRSRSREAQSRRQRASPSLVWRYHA